VPDINVLAVLAAGIVAFFVGFAYYALLGDQLATVSEAAAVDDRPPPRKVAVEILRCLLLPVVIVGLASRADIEGWGGGLLLGLALWIGFPFVLWVGAVIHENTPLKLAAIHAGDWLIKLVVVGLIATVWR
jgi:hypothetical protein